MSISPLPSELYRPIVEGVTSPRDLYSIALSCRQLRHEGQRILFREPSLSSIEQHLCFLDSVIASPDRLALFVFRYCQQVVAKSMDKPARTYHPGDMVTLVGKTERAIPLMKELEKLHYIPFTFWHQTPLNTFFNANFQFQLDAFDWGEEESTMAIIQSFLPSQPKLRHLGLIGEAFFSLAPSVYGVGTDLCPELDSLHAGSWGVVHGFLPGRKITRLTWETGIGEPFIITPMASFSSEFRQLRYLAFDIGGPAFESIACHLESLELLELYTSASLEGFRVRRSTCLMSSTIFRSKI